MVKKGSVFVISAPSGAGKSTLVKALLAHDAQLVLSISHTTRAPRGHEKNGGAYFFVDEATFTQKVENQEFLEWAKVHGNSYGTDRQFIETHLAQGHDVLLEIDWQGAKQIKQNFTQAVCIFILPPSLKDLEERLYKRGEDSPSVIARRLLAAGHEMSHVSEFDYVVVNQELDKALAELRAIVLACRCEVKRSHEKLANLFEELGISDSFSSAGPMTNSTGNG